MKTAISSLSRPLFLVVSFFLFFSTNSIKAQLCTNALDSVYSLTTNGQFHSLNINNGNPSVGILGGVAVTNAINANGLGFSSVTGKFYFFNRCANGDFNEFVSYSPVTGLKQVLANPPAPMTTASSNKIRTGSVTNDGTGFYSILTTSPATAATFYYYNIGTNTWKIIAQAFKDTATGASLDSMFHNLNSGDMTFDGAGNLWIICSKSPKYALYKVKAPVTTNTVSKLAVSVMIPTRNMPIATSVASITGVAFNSAGKLFFTTGSNSALAAGVSTVGTNYNILYRMSSVSPLVIDSIANIPNSYGDDLTSCIYPAAVLGTTFSSFSASRQNNSAKLLWTVNEDEKVSGYDIEYSNDTEHWQTIGHIESNNSSAGLKTYNYTHNDYSQGKNFYRIAQLLQSGRKNISEIRLIDTRDIGKIYIGPNPVNDVIYFYNKDNDSKLFANVFDNTGKLIYSTIVSPDRQSINVNHLPGGSFILRLSSAKTYENLQTFHFIKL